MTVAEVWAVIPARDEAPRVGLAIASARGAGAGRIVVVANGCRDRTADSARAAGPGVEVVEFSEPLGPDLPRVVGASVALAGGAEALLFLDGDMTGALAPALAALVQTTAAGAHLALTDAFARGVPGSSLAGEVTAFRRRLNQVLGLEEAIGVASMSHGPSAARRELVAVTGLRALGKPPVAVALAVRAGLRVRVGCKLVHDDLGSPGRDAAHAVAMAHTIIGDCLEAMAVAAGVRPSRCHLGTRYDGYDSTRRWDLLDAFLAGGTGPVQRRGGPLGPAPH